MLTIRSLPGAPLEVNCYLIADEAAGEAVVIDAPKQVAEEITRWTEELGVRITQIICTHGHWDHTMGLPEMIEAWHAPVACHENDRDMLEHPSTAPFTLPFILVPVTPDRLLAEGDVITVGKYTLTVLNTPGHTPGCICLYCAEEEIIFTGDILFAGTMGRMDFPGGDPAAMVRSLCRLRELPPSTRVMPGHGASTTIARESWLAHAEEIEEG